MVAVQIRYWAGAAAAAGLDTETIAAGSVAEALTTARKSRDDHFAQVLSVASVLLDGRRCTEADLGTALTQDARVEVLPPFAGG